MQAKPTNLTMVRRQGGPSVFLSANRAGRFDDVSGRKLVAPTYTGTIVPGVGQFGPATTFDGSTSLVNLGTTSFLQPSIASDWALLCWVKVPSVSAFGVIYQNNTVRVFFSAGNLALDPTTGSPVSGNATVNVTSLANQWIFVTATWRAATLTSTIAVNGRTPAARVDAAARTPSGPTAVGGPNVSTPNLNGMLDLVQVYERVPTQAEIDREYAMPFWRFDAGDEDDLAFAGLSGPVIGSRVIGSPIIKAARRGAA